MARIGNVAYQLPCNCRNGRCDRSLGHTSPHSCFKAAHGTGCDTCARMGFLTCRMTKAGKSPAEIRAAVARHAYEIIDLEKQ